MIYYFECKRLILGLQAGVYQLGLNNAEVMGSKNMRFAISPYNVTVLSGASYVSCAAIDLAASDDGLYAIISQSDYVANASLILNETLSEYVQMGRNISERLFRMYDLRRYAQHET